MILIRKNGIISLVVSMRIKKIKGAKEHIESSMYLIKNPNDYKGKWNTYFNNNNPICIEIGCGKGKFIVENAMKNPNINYIGIAPKEKAILEH